MILNLHADISKEVPCGNGDGKGALGVLDIICRISSEYGAVGKILFEGSLECDCKMVVVLMLEDGLTVTMLSDEQAD